MSLVEKTDINNNEGDDNVMMLNDDKMFDIERIRTIVAYIKRKHSKQEIRDLITNMHLIGEQEEGIDESTFAFDIEELLAALFPESDYCNIQLMQSREWTIQKKDDNDDVAKMMTKFERRKYCSNNVQYGLMVYDDKSQTQIELFLDNYNKVTSIRWTPLKPLRISEVMPEFLPNAYPSGDFEDEPKCIREALDKALSIAREARKSYFGDT
jgi:hypothetical protein